MCLFINKKEFDEIIKKVVPEDTIINHDSYGCIYFKNRKNNSVNERKIFEKIAKYLDLFEVTSIHIDDFNKPGVWICFK